MNASSPSPSKTSSTTPLNLRLRAISPSAAGCKRGTWPPSAALKPDAAPIPAPPNERDESVEQFILEVEDTGIGIPLQDQERVFERFYTVNRSRGGADRGTGLGLSIVKHAVSAMQGTVSLFSEPGKGTMLRCSFPLRREETEVRAAG